MLAAAADLLVEGGPTAVTVDAIVAASGVAKSTIYRHWESRDEILRETIVHLVPTIAEPQRDLGFEASLRAIVGGIVETFVDPEWARVLPALLLLRQLQPDFALVEEDIRHRHVEVLRAVLAKGAEEGRVRAGIEPERAAALLIGPLLFAHLTGSLELDAAYADEIVDMFLAAHR